MVFLKTFQLGGIQYPNFLVSGFSRLALRSSYPMDTVLSSGLSGISTGLPGLRRCCLCSLSTLAGPDLPCSPALINAGHLYSLSPLQQLLSHAVFSCACAVHLQSRTSRGNPVIDFCTPTPSLSCSLLSAALPCRDQLFQLHQTLISVTAVHRGCCTLLRLQLTALQSGNCPWVPGQRARTIMGLIHFLLSDELQYCAAYFPMTEKTCPRHFVQLYGLYGGRTSYSIMLLIF